MHLNCGIVFKGLTSQSSCKLSILVLTIGREVHAKLTPRPKESATLKKTTEILRQETE
jgi:hypothetical protein